MNLPRISKSAFLIFCAIVFASSARAEDEGYLLKLKWRPVEGVAHYRIQISTGAEFVALSVDERTEGPAFEWEPDLRSLKPGDVVFFRIASVDDSGVAGTFSSAQKITLPDLTAEENQRLKEAQAKRVKTRVLWFPEAEIRTGLAQFIESAQQADFKGAALATPYLSYALEARARIRSVQMLGANVLNEVNWNLGLYVRANPFRALTVPRAFTQTALVGWEGELKFSRETSWILAGGRVGVGGVALVGFSFVKSGSEAVATQTGFSAGPALEWESELAVGSPLKPRVLRAALGLPVIGYWLGGPAGVELSAEARWPFHRLSERTSLYLAAGAQGEAALWASPAGTVFGEWSLWIAPSLSL